jgi:hypothetical protein
MDFKLPMMSFEEVAMSLVTLTLIFSMQKGLWLPSAMVGPELILL